MTDTDSPGAAVLPGPDQLPTLTEFPDPFVSQDGRRIATAADWAQRRAEIQASLLDYEYGHPPPPPGNVKVTETSSDTLPDGAARERLALTCGPGDALPFHLDLILPAGRSGPFPVLLTGDRGWGPAPIPEEVAARGYLLAEFDRTEFAPDAAGRNTGVYPLYPGCDVGGLAAWAWGYHRAIDYLLTRADVDAARIAVTGHSRGGKAALLAGALDERVALTAPNDSGCGGAGSYRFAGLDSETLEVITRVFPYWFHPRLREFAGQEERLPIDQHLALALVAPRALLITNALDDLWANPQGTQQTYLATREVYSFLGAREKIGNHYRGGGHAQNADDWRTLLDFADAQFFGLPLGPGFEGDTFPGAPRAFTWTAPR